MLCILVLPNYMKTQSLNKKGTDASLEHAFFLAMDAFFAQVAQIQSSFRSVALLMAFEYSTHNVKQQKNGKPFTCL